MTEPIADALMQQRKQFEGELNDLIAKNERHRKVITFCVAAFQEIIENGVRPRVAFDALDQKIKALDNPDAAKGKDDA